MMPIKKFLNPLSSDFDSAISLLSRPLVFTNGIFDILHAAHVEFLIESKALGKTLIVALNDDPSAAVQGKTIAQRPIQSLEDRLFIVAGLASVDLVTCFSEPTPLELIKRICPDILVKGTDYSSLEGIVGRREVESYGGRVALVDTLRARSTTKIIEKAQKLAL